MKLGDTVLGTGFPDQYSALMGTSVSTGSSGDPIGIAILLKEHNIQLFDSVRDTSCARTLVYPISSIWSICR